MGNVSPSAQKRNSVEANPFEHLTDHEASALRRQIETPITTQVTWRTLFLYASLQDLIIIIVSSIAAIAAGAAVPLNTVILGSLAGAFQNFVNGLSRAEFDSLVAERALFFVYLAVGEFVAIYVATVGFRTTGESLTRKIREKYLQALLAQNAAYFDLLGPGEIITRVGNTAVIQEGISEKLELVLSSLSTLFAAYIIGLIKFWKLTLILSSLTPVLFALGYVLGRYIVKYSKLSLAAYSQGGVLVEEAFSSIRTVTACDTQEKLSKEYDKYLTRAESFGFRMKCLAGSGPGLTICIFNLGYALASWMGSRYIVAGETNLAAVLTILLVMMLGAFALVKATQHIQAFTNAIAAATPIFATIDRVSSLDQLPNQGVIPETLEGHVELRNVKHIYPSRPDVVVLENLSLVIPAGTTLAITGASGCGKSSIIALLERFYSPVAGQVSIDGYQIEDLDLHWLRQQIGLVQQDPVLFSDTIEKNILYGLRGKRRQKATDDQSRRSIVEQAARLANAHDFITRLPQGYDTFVGERGSFLSGGQRQRIAIARALVGDPRILICDEATSALDSQSERVVQAALDRASQGRTTIIISHRMSTIRNADNIAVMGPGGAILEHGTFDALLAARSSFFDLVEAQDMSPSTPDSDDCIAHDEKADMLVSEKTFGSPDSVALDTGEHAIVDGKPALDNSDQRQSPIYSWWTLCKFTAGLNRQEWRVMLLGGATSIIAGAGEPVQCLILANSISTLSLPSSQYLRLRHDANFWSSMFVMIAFVMLACYLILGVCFAYGSERLVHHSRDLAFRSMLRQDIQFFDARENTVGSLASFLNTETTRLAGMSGIALGNIVQLCATLIIGYIVALAVGWKLALVCIATVPVLLLAGFLNIWSLGRFEAFQKDSYRESASYACEVTSSTRTIAAFTLEDQVCQHYHDLLVAQERRSLRFNLKSSVLFAASQSLGFLCMALCFWYGSSLLGDYSITQFYLVFFLVIFGTRSAANMFSLAPDIAKAKLAAADLKHLFERVPAIDISSSAGHSLEDIRGSVEFRNVDFGYQDGQAVLNGMSFTVQPGQYVALVGASGCGKSTTVSLLERFYDPKSGGVYVDGHDISSLNLKDYRSHLAMVSQEPTLYQGSIRDNITFAADKEDISEAQLIKVCKEADIHDFIVSLPAGFDTVVGSKGTMLSGGQKQRIAIARALIRDPKILLLDEATSALDSDSERVVQAALDAAAKGRTTIAVAHRLSTVRKADAILVVEGGRVVENGSHSTLMAQRGRYYQMVQLQSGEKQTKEQ